MVHGPFNVPDSRSHSGRMSTSLPTVNFCCRIQALTTIDHGILNHNKKSKVKSINISILSISDRNRVISIIYIAIFEHLNIERKSLG